MMFMGRIMSSKASHKNFQEHLLISRASRVLPMEQNILRRASEMPLCKNWGNRCNRAGTDDGFCGMESSQAEIISSKWIREKHFK